MAARPTRTADRPHRPRAIVVALTAVLLSAGCSEGVDEQAEPSPSPSPSVEGSRSATPTVVPSPTRLAQGESARITLSKNKRRGSVSVTVVRVRKGKIKDLSDFVLDKHTKRSTPYYADVRVKNTSDANLAGASVPLWGLDSTDTVLPAAEIRGTFGKCDDAPMPKKFTRGDRARTCLMFLVPHNARLAAVQYRPSDETAGIVSWPAG